MTRPRSHPAHIHSGTCADLGDVVLPLTDVTPIGDEAERTGATTAIPVQNSLTVVDMPLQEIIDGEYAINVHKSADEIDTYIACGDIGGVVTTDEGETEPELIIGLGELNGSGYSGIAWLGADGDQTRVAIDLAEKPSAGGASATAAQEATPGAADAGADAAAQSVAVEIKNFAFNPAEITVPVGGSVTWTNDDSTPAHGDRLGSRSAAVRHDHPGRIVHAEIRHGRDIRVLLRVPRQHEGHDRRQVAASQTRPATPTKVSF